MARSDFRHLHRLRVRFNEVDRQGIAHNSMHTVYFGTAMNEYYRRLDYDRLAEEAKLGTAIHVVKATINYRAPIQLDQEIEIGAKVIKLGMTSLTFYYEIFSADTDDVLATGEQIWVNTSKASHRSTPWSDGFRAAIRARDPDLTETGQPAAEASAAG